MNPVRARSVLAVAAMAAALAAVLAARGAQARASVSQDLSARGDDLAGRHAALAGDKASSCALCHVPRQPSARRAAWGGAVEAPGEPGPGGYETPSSRVCLSCHDGSLAGGYQGLGENAAAGHPIGMDYRSAWMADPTDFNPPDGNRSIRLEGGKVGCLSCHRLHGRADAGSRLGLTRNSCTACHNR